ncbi:uncharacterized protein NEMAJ01_1390 [Nematocida major]|uniref:uncharacterized protein n=1 Tax=Nematocida major TaxID=1912982 RepID=UPI00200742DC|nr:uncharacterized protein NEMAJ01_1390 [Nematocida major]KAH9386494.1 hypothetical protein NEMAJ01_1390 [Nematocida major]
MGTPQPKPATNKKDIDRVSGTFEDDIFSVHMAPRLLVILLNGKVFEKTKQKGKKADASSPEKYAEIFDLKEVVKHAEMFDETLYIATSTVLYKIVKPSAENQTQLELKEVWKTDFEKISALDIRSNEEVIAFGDHEGKVTVKTENGTFTYAEHEDIVVNVVALKKAIFTASEDGIILKTRIGETEPKDAYDVRFPIRYFGRLENKLVVFDAYGTPYTMNKTDNDLRKQKRVLKRITDVQRIGDTLYFSHKNDHYRATSYKAVDKLVVPHTRTEGFFAYCNRLYCYSGQEIKGWPARPATELEEFFEDL